MKHITAAMLLMLIIGKIGAIDTESYQFVDHLLTLPGPGIPHIFEDGVLFTAPSKEYGTVGISFAYEHFSKIHWFQKLVVPKDTGAMKMLKVRAGMLLKCSTEWGQLIIV
ncbi:hypothetical protein FACS1894200_08070 [Spirochaetia bacterium]|nr:hypothetical protein FACS1894200_08070 [Spirochaetia bacterium]